jgi:hypothetical protein
MHSRPSRSLTTALLSALVIGLPALTGALAQKDAGQQPSALPLVQISGSDSKIAERSHLLISSAREWNQLWHRHTGKPITDVSETDVPRVNFDRCVVVAVFQGPQNNLGVVAHSVIEQADRTILRLDNRYYGTVSRPNVPVRKDTPFGFFVLLRSDKPIVLEEAFYSSKTAPPVFKERARLKTSS